MSNLKVERHHRDRRGHDYGGQDAEPEDLWGLFLYAPIDRRLLADRIEDSDGHSRGGNRANLRQKRLDACMNISVLGD